MEIVISNFPSPSYTNIAVYSQISNILGFCVGGGVWGFFLQGIFFF